MSRNPFVTSENWRKLGGKDYQIPLSAPLHPTTPSGHPQTHSEIPRHSQNTSDISNTLPKEVINDHKHSWHSTDIFWHPHFSLSPFWHPLTTQMPLRLPGECLEVVKAVPGAQGNVFLVLGGVLECPRVSWGFGENMGGCGECLVVFSLQFASILGNHIWDPCHFVVDLKVPNVSNIKMSQRYGRFDLLGSLGRGFRAEL